MTTIRELRENHGWTQLELANRISVRPETVYAWEKGRSTPRVQQLRALGRLFGICSDDIDLVSIKVPERPSKEK